MEIEFGRLPTEQEKKEQIGFEEPINKDLVVSGIEKAKEAGMSSEKFAGLRAFMELPEIAKLKQVSMSDLLKRVGMFGAKLNKSAFQMTVLVSVVLSALAAKIANSFYDEGVDIKPVVTLVSEKPAELPVAKETDDTLPTKEHVEEILRRGGQITEVVQPQDMESAFVPDDEFNASFETFVSPDELNSEEVTFIPMTMEQAKKANGKLLIYVSKDHDDLDPNITIIVIDFYKKYGTLRYMADEVDALNLFEVVGDKSKAAKQMGAWAKSQANPGSGINVFSTLEELPPPTNP